MNAKYIGLSLLLAAWSCTSPTEHNVSRRDPHGNYITTSDYEAMQRTEFNAAMEAGLKDYDAGVRDLRERANTLGGENLKEFSDYAEKLEEQRTTFVNEMEKSKVVLDDDWSKHRTVTLKAYYAMRDGLDEAYEEVLEN